MSAIGRCLPLTHGIAAAREVAAGASFGDVSGLVWTEAGIGLAYATGRFRPVSHPRTRVAPQRRARRVLVLREPGSIRGVIPPLLRDNRKFRNYFFGQAVSLLGDQITLIALPLTAVLALHATAGQMGALTTVALVPNLIFSLHAGSWVDRRGGRRQVMLVADVRRGILIGTVPVAYALGHLTWAQLYVVAFGSGVLSVFFYVAYGGFFQTIVEREDYVAANSLAHGSRAFSFLAGTSIGGVLVQVLRGPYALAIDAVSFLWSALFLGRINAVDPPAGPESTGGIMAGARWIRNNAIIRAELLGIATLNFFNFIYFALFLLYATRELHVQPAALGLVLGAASVGTLLGSVITGRVSRRFGVGPAFLFGCFLFPAPLILVPLAGGPHWLVLAVPVHGRVLLRHRSDAARHPRGLDQRCTDPENAALARLRRVHGREQRRAAGRDGGRRSARHGDRPAADPVDRDGRRAVRNALPAALADPLAARCPGGGPE